MTDPEFEEIFSQHKQDVLNIAFYYLHHLEDAEDVTMDVFADFYAHPPKEVTHLKAYLLKMAMNKALDLLRKRKRAPLPFDEGIEGKKENGNDLSEKLGLAIRKLPKKLSEAVVLCYLAGLSNEEAAHALHCSESTLRKRLERAKRKLKEEWKDD